MINITPYFDGIATFIVGIFAFILYKKQKSDNKRDAAALILQEIRYAEQQIRNARTLAANYYLGDKLLPTNSWHKNINLFVKDLTPTEIDLISRFYSNASYLDTVISKISDYKNSQYYDPKTNRPVVLVPMSLPIHPQATGQTSSLQTTVNQQQVGETLSTPSPANLPQPEEPKLHLYATKILEEVSGKIEFLYNTPAVGKLNGISQRKWYQIF